MIKIMILAAIITGIILIFLVALTDYIGDKKHGKFNDGITLGVFITIFVFIEYALIACIIDDKNPTAMDVYKGKTALEYKIVDDVKVDSVVVFKNDYYGSN